MRYLLVLFSLVALSACTAYVVGGSSGGTYQHDSAERPPNVVASDAAITTTIRSKYAADSTVSMFRIAVYTYNGTVRLTGAVGSIAARNRAGELARATNGVKAVNNQIVIEDRSQ